MKMHLPDNLQLRPFKEEDLSSFLNMQIETTYLIDDISDFYKLFSYILYTTKDDYQGIFLDETLVGCVYIHKNKKGAGEIGLFVDTRYTNRHIASNALKKMLENRQEPYFYAYILQDNIASQKVFENNGFQFQKKKEIEIKGQIFDICLYTK